jgi:phosphatidylserine/phosphatidylglycerophosphate/cardiolipin synthase-like enzyme
VALIQSPNDQPIALAFRYFELLDRKLDRRLLIRLMVDDANELSPAPRGAVNAPGVAFRLLGRFVHRATTAEKAAAWHHRPG